MNGGFEENKLSDPSSIVACLDDDTAHVAVFFIGTVFDKAANGGLSDIPVVLKLIRDFLDSIPDEAQNCLSKNKELWEVGHVYGIDSADDLTNAEKKMLAYGTLHFIEVHN